MAAYLAFTTLDNLGYQLGVTQMALQIIASGVSVATSAASAGTTIPLGTNGAVPRYVRFASTQNAYVKMGTGAQTSTAGDMLISPGDATIIATLGNTHFAALQVTLPGVVQASPVEDI